MVMATRFLSATLGVMLAFVFISCGDDNGSPTPTPKPEYDFGNGNGDIVFNTKDESGADVKITITPKSGAKSVRSVVHEGDAFKIERKADTDNDWVLISEGTVAPGDNSLSFKSDKGQEFKTSIDEETGDLYIPPIIADADSAPEDLKGETIAVAVALNAIPIRELKIKIGAITVNEESRDRAWVEIYDSEEMAGYLGGCDIEANDNPKSIYKAIAFGKTVHFYVNLGVQGGAFSYETPKKLTIGEDTGYEVNLGDINITTFAVSGKADVSVASGGLSPNQRQIRIYTKDGNFTDGMAMADIDEDGNWSTGVPSSFADKTLKFRAQIISYSTPDDKGDWIPGIYNYNKEIVGKATENVDLAAEKSLKFVTVSGTVGAVKVNGKTPAALIFDTDAVNGGYWNGECAIQDGKYYLFVLENSSSKTYLGFKMTNMDTERWKGYTLTEVITAGADNATKNFSDIIITK
jgi:hypothetical protein